METINLTQTMKGAPALWEGGGATTNAGTARIIAGPAGNRLRPIAINTRGSLSNGEHALFAVRPGYVVIDVDRVRENISIRISRLTNFENSEADAILLSEWEGTEKEFFSKNNIVPDAFWEAAEAGVKKSLCYHCREPHYFSNHK